MSYRHGTYPHTMTESEESWSISIEQTVPTREECMEMGICYQCSGLFEIVLVDGLCNYCDEEEYERRRLAIPDDACWWEYQGEKLVCGTDSMCPCRSYFEMELFKTREWYLDEWSGGTCSRATREFKKRSERERYAKIMKEISDARQQEKEERKEEKQEQTTPSSVKTM